MLVMFLLTVLGGSIPQADIDKICKGAQVDALPEDRASALRSCIGDETSAKDQIKRDWTRFTAADWSNCAPTPAMQFSYVELLTCLEMQRGGNFFPDSQAGSPKPSPKPPTGTRLAPPSKPPA
jgi:hypothetical protein